MYGITCRAWHRDASNSLDALPVVPCRRLIPCLPRPHAGSSRFPIWRRQGRRPWHTAEIMWPICPLPHSGNWFKMAAKIRSETIWVGVLDTDEKQTKWRQRQRQTRKELKLCKNAITSHKNTVEWNTDLIFCSMTFICFLSGRSSVHGT